MSQRHGSAATTITSHSEEDPASPYEEDSLSTVGEKHDSDENSFRGVPSAWMPSPLDPNVEPRHVFAPLAVVVPSEKNRPRKISAFRVALLYAVAVLSGIFLSLSCTSVVSIIAATIEKVELSGRRPFGGAAESYVRTAADKSGTDRAMIELEWDAANYAELEFCHGYDEVAGGEVFGYRLPSSDGNGTSGSLSSSSSSCGPAGVVVRMTPGRSYTLRLRNAASQSAANIHTHGLHISGSGNADNVTRHADPGQCLLYNWTIPADHMGGTFWIHSHVYQHHNTKHDEGMEASMMGADSSMVVDPVAAGAYALLIIEEQEDLLRNVAAATGGAGASSEEAAGAVVVEDNESVQKIRDWLWNELYLMIGRIGKTDRFLANGRADLVLRLQQGVWYRLRLAAVDRYTPKNDLLFPQSCQVHATAQDGVWRFFAPKLSSQHQYALTGAGRMDFAIRCSEPGRHYVRFGPGQAAVAVLAVGTPGESKDLPLEQQQQQSNETTVSVAQEESPTSSATAVMVAAAKEGASPFATSGGAGGGNTNAADGETAWQPSRPYYLRDLRGRDAGDDDFVRYKVNMDGGLTVNGQSHDPGRPLAEFAYGSLQEWLLTNTTGHPAHLHVYPMQVVDCPGHDAGEYYDTLSSVLQDDGRTSSSCLVRFHMIDYAQTVMIHDHAEGGAMVWFDVQVSPPASAASVEGEEGVTYKPSPPPPAVQSTANMLPYACPA